METGRPHHSAVHVCQSADRGGVNYSGLGDIEQGYYLARLQPVDGWIMGGGLELTYPPPPKMPSGLANGVPGRQCWCFGRNKHFTSFGLNAESTYNWQASQWLVPVNVSVTQLLKFGKQPVSIQLGYRYYAEGSNSDPDWGLRFSVTYLFPK